MLYAPRRLHHHKKLLTVIISALHRNLIRILGVADSFFRGWGPGGMRRRHFFPIGIGKARATPIREGWAVSKPYRSDILL